MSERAATPDGVERASSSAAASVPRPSPGRGPAARRRAPGSPLAPHDAELAAWSEEILTARHREATDRFCRMMREGRDRFSSPTGREKSGVASLRPGRRVVLQTDAPTILQHLTELLQAGKSVIQLADGVTAAAARAISELENPRAFFMLGHAYDYLNVVNHWLRTYPSPHAPKFPFLQALFVNERRRVKQFAVRNRRS